MKITATFTCQGCYGVLVPGPDLTYGYRCVCGWVLLAAPRFTRKWVTLVPRGIGA